MSIVISSTGPAIYLTKRKTVFSYDGPTGRGAETSIEALSKRANGFSPLLTRVLIKLLAKLYELGISFRLQDIKIERDVEIPTWKYAVIDIGLDWRGNPRAFERICDYLIDNAYAILAPKEATKVLLVFSRV